jgi:hypothetical protein
MIPVWALFWSARLAIALIQHTAAAMLTQPEIESKLFEFNRYDPPKPPTRTAAGMP